MVKIMVVIDTYWLVYLTVHPRMLRPVPRFTDGLSLARASNKAHGTPRFGDAISDCEPYDSQRQIYRQQREQDHHDGFPQDRAFDVRDCFSAFYHGLEEDEQATAHDRD